MRNVKITIWVMVTVLISSGQVMALTQNNDGGIYNIATAINDDVWVDWDTPGMQTTVNLLNGGSIPNPYALQGYNNSRINISGGTVGLDLYSWDSSTVNMTGGTINYINPKASSTVDISGGTINTVGPRDSSIVNISGGTINDYLYAWDSSTLNISGGDIEYLYVREFSTVTFYGQNFHYGSGLTLDGNRIIGTGALSGEWLNGTSWVVNIGDNDSTATLLIPEPTTLLLLSLGAVILRRKR